MIRRLLTLACVLLAAAATAAEAPFRLSPQEYIPVSEVRPGMTGYGLTVFKGVKIEKFGVKVVAVMPQYNFGRPVVLVMMSGGPITKRHANIIAGMSGSPVYIGGRLLGAVALGDSTPKEPVGMVVPIEDMVDAFDPKLPSKPSVAYSAPQTDSKWAALMPSGASLPLFASGFGPRGLAGLNGALAPLGLHAMAGPSGGNGALPAYFPKNVRLEPGSAIAVSLIQGDVDLTAIGTVTYRKGNRILAFGHPFLQYGAAEYPASTAYIHDVFSSVVRSYKMGTAISTVGTITQDRPFSVGGFVRRLPNMVPMTVRVADRTSGRTRRFTVKMVNHPLLLPMLVPLAAAELIDRVRPYPGDCMGTVKIAVAPDGYAPISRTNTFFDANSLSTAGLSDLLDTLTILSRNPFEPVRIKRVDVSVDLWNGHSTAAVERAWIEKDKVEPGDTVTVQAIVKPFKQPAEPRTLQVKIPQNAPNGQAQVVIFGGATGFGRITAGPPIPGMPPMAATSVSNVKQLIARFLERERNDELGVRVLLPGSAVAIDGERLGGLPDPLADVLKSTKATATRLERDELRASQRTPWVLTGSQSLTITIERKTTAEKPAASTTATAATATTTVVTTTTTTTTTTDSDALEAAAADEEAERFATMATKPEPKPKATEAAPEPKAAEPKPVEAKPAEEKTEQAEADKEAKGPGRLATVWKQSTKAQFDAGKLTATTVTSKGDVELVASLEPVNRTTRPYVWCILPNADGSAYIGTGNRGEILKTNTNGSSTVFASTQELEIHALARDKAGNLYAATSPHGRILKVTPAGKVSTYFETGEKYVLALTMDQSGTLYAGTAPNAQVFAISPDGKGRPLVKLQEGSVLCLAAAKDGSVLAGTGPDGVLYRVGANGTASVAYDATEANLTAVATNDAGDIYVATAPNGKVYKVLPDGRSEVLIEKPEGNVLAMLPAPDGGVYAAGGKRLYRVAADKTVAILDNTDQNQLVSLAAAPDGGILAGSANTGVLYRINAPKTGTYESAVHDADLSAHWGRMEWGADANGGKVEIQTRTGNVLQPDETWSPWSAPVSGAGSAQVTSPAGRYLQYRATLTAGDGGKSPSLRWLSVRYLPNNRPPTVKLTDPKEGDRFAGKKTVKWTGTDPDNDQLSYTLYVSADDGATWTPLNTTPPTPKPEPPRKQEETPERTAKNAETMRLVTEEIERHDLSPEMRTTIRDIADAALKGRPDETASSAEAADDLSKTSYTWDTNTVKDGSYRLKVVASDKPSNPESDLSDENTVGPVLVCNTKPSVIAFERNTAVGSDRAVTVQGEATSPTLAIVRVSYRIDKGNWTAAVAQDGIFDSPSERWKIVTAPLAVGDHTVEVKAADEADNTGTTTTKVTVK